MSGIKIAYILSLLVLVGLVAVTVFKPMVAGEEYSEVAQTQLLKTEDEWILQFDLINNEGRDQEYVINVEVDGKQYNERVLIPDGSVFSYIRHFYQDGITDKSVRFAFYRKGEATSFKEVTYYLK